MIALKALRGGKGSGDLFVIGGGGEGGWCFAS